MDEALLRPCSLLAAAVPFAPAGRRAGRPAFLGMQRGCDARGIRRLARHRAGGASSDGIFHQGCEKMKKRRFFDPLLETM